MQHPGGLRKDDLFYVDFRGGFNSFLALSVKVVVQEHLFLDHFKGNLQLHFSLNVPPKFSISHALFKHPR